MEDVLIYCCLFSVLIDLAYIMFSITVLISDHTWWLYFPQSIDVLITRDDELPSVDWMTNWSLFTDWLFIVFSLQYGGWWTSRHHSKWDVVLMINWFLAVLMIIDWLLIEYWLFSLQYGGWWTSVSGWDGWVWLSTCCSASWRCIMSLKFTASVWSTCREVGPAPRLRPSPTAGLRASALACHHFLSGCGRRSSCCHTCNSSFSCSPAREPTLEPSATACFLSASPCCAAGVTLPAKQPIWEARRSSTHREVDQSVTEGQGHGGGWGHKTNWTVCADVCDVTSCVPFYGVTNTPVGFKPSAPSVRTRVKLPWAWLSGSGQLFITVRTHIILHSDWLSVASLAC